MNVFKENTKKQQKDLVLFIFIWEHLPKKKKNFWERHKWLMTSNVYWQYSGSTRVGGIPKAMDRKHCGAICFHSIFKILNYLSQDKK